MGWVEPNPAVGAVLTDRNGRLIASGWHERFGGPHAEINALRLAGEQAANATLYCTLEPCCHTGKTPPCSRAIIAAGIRRVVIGTIDPAPHVGGGGMRELQAAGIEVVAGVCELSAKRLIAPFIKLMLERRPYLHAKWAMTLDGKTASRSSHSQWISNGLARERVHALRGRMDGIVVGIGTAIADDPLLTARPAGPRTPVRIVIDSRARLPPDSQLVKSARLSPVLVVTGAGAAKARQEALEQAGVEVIRCEPSVQDRATGNRSSRLASRAGGVDLPMLMEELGRRNYTNLLIEGGASIFGSCFDARLIDEVHVFIAPKLVGGQAAVTAVAGEGLLRIPQMPQLTELQFEILDDNIYVHGAYVHGQVTN